jgi:hypothetical protein
VKVLRSADSLAIALDSLDFLGRQVDHYLRSEIQIPEGNAALELVIEASLSFDDVVDKLEALRGLYSLTADLLSVDTREFPPLARRLEAGSLWMNIVVSSHNVGTS